MRYILPKYAVHYACQFVIWVAAPILVITSISVKGLVSELWTVPIISIIAIVIGAVFSFIAIDLNRLNERILVLLSGSINKLNVSSNSKNKPDPQYTTWVNNLNSSFMLGGMLGSNSYIAFPIIILSLTSDQMQYFIWVALFDVCSSFWALCSIPLTAHFIHNQPITPQVFFKPIKNIFLNPIFWSLFIGLFISNFNLPDELKDLPNQIRNVVIPLCLIAIGMQINLPIIGNRRNRVSSYTLQGVETEGTRNKGKRPIYPIFNEYYFNSRLITQSTVCLLIKMGVVPLVVAAFLLSLRIDNLPILVIMLQVAMPPLLINDDISKEYDLYRDFNMAVNSIGCIVLVVIVPILLTLFNLNIV
jgi:predicted permease